jgi:hypothetical protein
MRREREGVKGRAGMLAGGRRRRKMKLRVLDEKRQTQTYGASQRERGGGSVCVCACLQCENMKYIVGRADLKSVCAREAE